MKRILHLLFKMLRILSGITSTPPTCSSCIANNSGGEAEALLPKQILPDNGSICFSDTLSGKKVNEDAHLHLTNSRGMTIFAVADGLGSYSEAAEASHQVIEYIKAHAEDITTNSDFLTRFFRDMNAHLCEIAQKNEYGNRDREHLLGTTLILGIETADSVTFAYAGNGAVIHVRGYAVDFAGFGKTLYSWFAANMLIPHSMPENGSEALYKFLSNDDTVDVTPTVITINKDSMYGDAFIICTDGIASLDHVLLHKNADETRFVEYDKKLHDLYILLKSLKNCTTGVAEQIEKGVNSFLKDHQFEDDATLCILVTPKFYNHLQ